MGWYFGNPTRADVIRELTEENENVRTLRKFTSGNTLWTVHEVKADGSRFIGCYLMQRDGRKDNVCWGYKPMDESMGPCELTCPLAFLEMVPDPGGYATDWRKHVREYHARVGMKLVVGDIVRLTNNEDMKITRVRPLRGVSQKTGILYRIPRKMLLGKVTPIEVTVVQSAEHLQELLKMIVKCTCM